MLIMGKYSKQLLSRLGELQGDAETKLGLLAQKYSRGERSQVGPYEVEVRYLDNGLRGAFINGQHALKYDVAKVIDAVDILETMVEEQLW